MLKEGNQSENPNRPAPRMEKGLVKKLLANVAAMCVCVCWLVANDLVRAITVRLSLAPYCRAIACDRRRPLENTQSRLERKSATSRRRGSSEMQ